MNKFSLIIPMFNEEKNVKILYNQICASLKKIKNYEIIFINDFSSDNTLNNLREIERTNINLKILNNKKNLGQSFSIINGIKKANSDVIITLDGDCQNDPNDIINLYEKFISNSSLKLVAGIRMKRQDNIIKIVSSIVANKIRSFILKDDCPDTGCGLKVFDKRIFLNFDEFDGIHRFLPALFKGFGHMVLYLPVRHRSRMYGKSKYGTVKRAIRGIKDIILVKKMIDKSN